MDDTPAPHAPWRRLRTALWRIGYGGADRLVGDGSWIINNKGYETGRTRRTTARQLWGGGLREADEISHVNTTVISPPRGVGKLRGKSMISMTAR